MRWRDTVGRLSAAQDRHRFPPDHLDQQRAVAIVLLAAHPLADTEQGHLIEPLCFGIGQPEDAQVGEVTSQQWDGGVQPLLRHHHQQHATLDQPAERVLEEEVLHPLVIP